MLLTLTTPGLLIARSLEMSGAPVHAVPRVVPLVVAHTDFGHLWIARVAGLALLWLLWGLQFITRRPAGEGEPGHRAAHGWLALAAISAVAFTRSASGHAGDHGDLRAAVWIDWLHIVGAGLWGGVILAFAAAVYPELRRAPSMAAAEIVARFSRLAGIGLALVVATGALNAWRALGAWTPLWSTRYGLILDAKLGAFVAMALLGAANRFRNVPAVGGRAMGAERRALRDLLVASALEAVLFLGVLAAAALLLQAAPPAS